jgi:ArsR family transcriptional regulator
MNLQINIQDVSKRKVFEKYESKFKAIADQKRLQIMNILTEKGEISVGDLAQLVDMTQSKLSYHLRVLLDAKIITKETKGTWSYYQLNQNEINHLLSEELCCLFRPTNC